jgi:hypothetical protein
LDKHAAERKAALGSRRGETARLAGAVRKLSQAIDNLTDAIAVGGPPTMVAVLKNKLNDRIDERCVAQAALDEHLSLTCTFELNHASVASYLKAVDTLSDRLINSPREQLDIDAVAKIEALIDKVFVHPNHNGHGFEVEVFGALATLVSGVSSYRTAHHKSFDVKHMLDSETLAIRRATQNLKMVLFRLISKLKSTVFKETADIMQSVDHPVVGSEIASMLANAGVQRNLKSIIQTMTAHPETFVRLRGGFMLRSRWEGQDKRWFRSTEQIVDTARNLLSDPPGTLTLQDILDGFDRLGLRIYGKNKLVLGGVLTRHPAVFENVHLQKGKWTLRRSQLRHAARRGSAPPTAQRHTPV